MSNKIVLTSPDRKTTRLLEKVRKEYDFKIDAYEATFDDAVELIRGKVAHREHWDPIIATGGATLGLLRDNLGRMPWVNIFPTEYDLVIALEQAKKTKKTIGLFNPGQIDTEAIKAVCSAIQIDAHIYRYNSWKEVLVQVEKAYQDGVEVAIGAGEKISSAVERKNIQYVSVTSGEYTIRRAFKYAQLLVDLKRNEKVSHECIKTIADSTHEGMIHLNENRILVNFNANAAKFFGLHEKDVIGKSVQDLSGCPSLAALLKDFDQKLNFLHHTPKGTILVNKVPILHNHQFRGIMINFKEANQEEWEKTRATGTKGLVAKHHFRDIINNNSKMSEVITMAMRYANTDCNVLIKGETGTGKELISQSIHNGHRQRSRKPFVAVNCASLDGSLLNSELFGYSEGAFTGASKGRKPGLFEIAHGGTLFLDEIDKMKKDVQANLLRVLQEKEIRRIGSDQVVSVDVRIIAASNEDLLDLVRKGEFREDLYYRLNVLKLTLPPLRERRGDIPHLVRVYLQKYTEKYNKINIELPAAVLDKISHCEWYGNIRQLNHFIERCVVLCDDGNDLPEIILMMLEEEFSTRPTLHAREEEEQDNDTINVRIRSLEEMNAEIVHRVKAKTKISNGELALMMGISRPTLLKMLKSGR